MPTLPCSSVWFFNELYTENYQNISAKECKECVFIFQQMNLSWLKFKQFCFSMFFKWSSTQDNDCQSCHVEVSDDFNKFYAENILNFCKQPQRMSVHILTNDFFYAIIFVSLYFFKNN